MPEVSGLSVWDSFPFENGIARSSMSRNEAQQKFHKKPFRDKTPASCRLVGNKLTL